MRRWGGGYAGGDCERNPSKGRKKVEDAVETGIQIHICNFRQAATRAI